MHKRSFLKSKICFPISKPHSKYSLTTEKKYKSTKYEEKFKRKVGEKADNPKIEIKNRYDKEEDNHRNYRKLSNFSTNKNVNKKIINSSQKIVKHSSTSKYSSSSSSSIKISSTNENVNKKITKSSQKVVKHSSTSKYSSYSSSSIKLSSTNKNVNEKIRKSSQKIVKHSSSSKYSSSSSSSIKLSSRTEYHRIQSYDDYRKKSKKKRKSKESYKNIEQTNKLKDPGKEEFDEKTKATNDGIKDRIIKKKRQKLPDNEIETFRNMHKEFENEDIYSLDCNYIMKNKENILSIGIATQEDKESIAYGETKGIIEKEESDKNSQSQELLQLDCDLVEYIQGLFEVDNSNKSNMGVDHINFSLPVKENDSDDSIICTFDSNLNSKDTKNDNKNIKQSNEKVFLQNNNIQCISVDNATPEISESLISYCATCNVSLVDLFKDLASIEKYLGSNLGVLIIIVYKKVEELQNKGENPMNIFEDYINVETLYLTIDRLTELLNDSRTTIVQKTIYEEYKEKVNAVLIDAEKILFDGINIENIAEATLEKEPSEVISFIQSILDYLGKEDIKENKKRAIYMAVKEKQFDIL